MLELPDGGIAGITFFLATATLFPLFGLPRTEAAEALVAFITASPKATDLATDGRYALHNPQHAAVPDECQVRGRNLAIDDEATRARLAASWYCGAGDEYRLFEFRIHQALLGERVGSDEWPPRYTSWKSTDQL